MSIKTQILFMLTVVIGICSAQGQTTFAKYYYGVGTAKFNLIQLPNGEMFTGMANESGISVIDSEGTFCTPIAMPLTPSWCSNP